MGSHSGSVAAARSRADMTLLLSSAVRMPWPGATVAAATAARSVAASFAPLGVIRRTPGGEERSCPDT